MAYQSQHLFFNTISMSNDDSHDEGELSATTHDEELAEDASTTSQNEFDELDEGSEGHEGGEENAEKPNEKAEELKQKQITAWQRKINLGEALIEDLPDNQKWLAGHLKPKAPSQDEFKRLAVDTVREEVARQREEESFTSLWSELRANLSPVKKAELKETYNELRTGGLSKLQALKMSVRVVNAATSKSGAVPTAGSYKISKSEKDIGEVSPSERVQELEKLRKRGRSPLPVK